MRFHDAPSGRARSGRISSVLRATTSCRRSRNRPFPTRSAGRQQSLDDLWPQITEPGRSPERDYSFGDPSLDQPDGER